MRLQRLMHQLQSANLAKIHDLILQHFRVTFITHGKIEVNRV